MLTLMRNLLRSKFAGLLFLLIIVSMAVWGTNDIFAPRTGGTIITAGERSLTVRDIDRTLEFFLSRQRNEGGTVLSREQAVEQGVVDQLFAVEASRTAALGYAEQIGAVATDEAVFGQIRDTPAFASEVTGSFDLDTYRLALRRADLTPTLYEQDVKDSRTLGYIGGAATAALDPPAILARIRAIQLAESRRVSWFTIDAGTVGPIADPDDEALAAFYQENQAAFRVPELRQAEVIHITPDDFIHRVEVPEEDLRAFYEGTKAQRFSAPERRTFTQAVAASETDARTLFGKLAGGATLSEGTDPELVGLNERAALRSELVIDDLAEGLFAPTAREGTVVGPVERDGLWIVARVDAIIPGEPIPYEDVRPVIFEELAATEAQGLYFDAVNELQTLIGAGLTARELADELGVPLLRRLPVSQAGRTRQGDVYLGLTDAQDFLAELFNTPEGFVTNPVAYGEMATLLGEVRDIQAAHTPELEEIRDSVLERYRTQTRDEAVQAFADGLAARVEAGEIDIAGAAEAAGRTLNQPGRAISRANFEVGLPQAALQPVFAASEGDIITAPGPEAGEVTLVSIDTITPPTEEEIEVLMNAERPRLAGALQTDMRAALDGQVRESVGFEADAEALAAYKASILTPQ